jgi:hypothetical protein
MSAQIFCTAVVVLRKVNMEKKDSRAKAVKDVNLQDDKPIHVIEPMEPTSADTLFCEWEKDQIKVGAEVAQALAVLTAAGVIEWQIGLNLMRASIRVEVAKDEPFVFFEKGEWSEGAEQEGFGGVRQEFYDFDDSVYKELMHHISRNWVYPNGY